MNRTIRRIETPAEFNPSLVADDTVFVIIDVYMFSSTVVTLFEQDVEEVYPIYHPDEFNGYLEDDSVFIGGERSNDDIETDFSNSPQSVHGRFGRIEDPPNAALTSDNGARRTIECIDAIEEQNVQNSTVIIGSTLNAQSVANFIEEEYPNNDVALICAGSNGSPAIEDVIGGMLIAQHLRNEDPFYTEYEEILEVTPVGMIENPEDFGWLPDEDVTHITNTDSSDIVPMYNFEREAFVEWS